MKKDDSKKPKIKSDLTDDHHEEIEYEEDHGAALIKKLRTKLKACEAEKKEYLDGWQRLKADNANSKKRNADMEHLVAKRARTDVLGGIIPVLDSFDMAFTGSAWESVDHVWRVGVEQIHTQLLDVLHAYGYIEYGEVGEPFNPTLHEAIESIDGGESGTIARVIRRGYKDATHVVRPAQVATYN